MIREIGSEFPLPSESETFGKNSLEFLPEAEDSVFVFSGRTAIETVIKDIGTVKKAMLPSYCCSSMIEPFLTAGIHVSFYNVYFNQSLVVDLNIDEDFDVILWCNYFGFNVQYPTEVFDEFRERGGIVIEDITHSLFSFTQHHDADYFVASIRKWGSLISGGYCAKSKGVFFDKPYMLPDESFKSYKYEAMKLKSEFLKNGLCETKDKYLNLYSVTNKMLADNYSGILMDEYSMNQISCWDFEEIRRIRIKNAEMIYQYLKICKEAVPLFSFEDMDCPLFVPVIVDKNKRGSLRQKLIEQGVFCPVHWPKPDDRCTSDLYDSELSLVCDQRYNLDDIKRMMNIICDF